MQTITSYITEQNIYHAVFILLASGLFWAILWGRKWKARLREEEGVANRAIAEKVDFKLLARGEMDRFRVDLAEKDQLIAFKNKQLDQKDAKIQEILDYSNDQAHHMLISHEEAQKIKSQMIREILVLKALLKANSNYARLIIHDPAKLEKWLESLKGKKTNTKHSKSTHAKDHQPLSAEL